MAATGGMPLVQSIADEVRMNRLMSHFLASKTGQ